MTKAEIHGKISHTGQNLSERMEDLLTSDVFSACQYVRPEILLIPFLRQAKGLNGETMDRFLSAQVERIQYRFWRRLHLSEPDVLIAIEFASGHFFLVLIEAKYFSSKSSSALSEEELEVAETPGDQLAREYSDLLVAHDSFHIPKSKVVGRALVYVTAHRCIPKGSLQESLAEIKRFTSVAETMNLFWANWFELHPIVSQAKNADGLENVILDDLRLLLERKGLIHFRGFSLVIIGKVLDGSIYEREVVERSLGYEFALVKETFKVPPIFYFSQPLSREYHWAFSATRLACKIYKGATS